MTRYLITSEIIVKTKTLSPVATERTRLNVQRPEEPAADSAGDGETLRPVLSDQEPLTASFNPAREVLAGAAGRGKERKKKKQKASKLERKK